MGVDRSYVTRNETERLRLEALVGKWQQADLEHAMPAGWTVAGVLAHLAFWDQRAVILLDRWQSVGATPPPEDEVDVDWINDAAKPLFLALSPPRAAELAVAAAREADRRAAMLPDELVARNTAAGTPVNLLRASHRREHLDEIERVLNHPRAAG
jgi:hypothetical protein